jgi:hypothetical protein
VLSDESVSQAKMWIEDCIHNHPLCPGPESATLPKRVIKIKDPKPLSLQEGGGQRVDIQHSVMCGGEQTFATTLDTIERNKDGFAGTDLPKTLQDAVLLTWTLGLEYIWIDSICIIQDSDEDRNIEIPKMSQYYRNSYVTISAAITSTVDSGFLNPRDECENHQDTGLPKDLMRMPYICPASDKKQAVGEILFREDSPYRLCDEPISKRAWTLQESILAPQILSYGTRLLFQCHAGQHSDGGIEDWTFDQQSSGHRRIQQEFSQSNNIPDIELPRSATRNRDKKYIKHGNESFTNTRIGMSHYQQTRSRLCPGWLPNMRKSLVTITLPVFGERI